MSQDQVTGTPVDPREEKRVVSETTTTTPAEPVKETVTETASTETTVEPAQSE